VSECETCPSESRGRAPWLTLQTKGRLVLGLEGGSVQGLYNACYRMCRAGSKAGKGSEHGDKGKRTQKGLAASAQYTCLAMLCVISAVCLVYLLKVFPFFLFIFLPFPV